MAHLHQQPPSPTRIRRMRTNHWRAGSARCAVDNGEEPKEPGHVDPGETGREAAAR